MGMGMGMGSENWEMGKDKGKHAPQRNNDMEISIVGDVSEWSTSLVGVCALDRRRRISLAQHLTKCKQINKRHKQWPRPQAAT